MEAAAQKKSNSRRRTAIQDYELRLANSHSPIAVVGLVFILIMCVVDGVPPLAVSILTAVVGHTGKINP